LKRKFHSKSRFTEHLVIRASNVVWCDWFLLRSW